MAALSSATVLEKIRENEELFAGSRKNLGKQTRLFKKHEGEEKLKHFGALLKLYQKEIDSLTKRAKFTETAYVQLDQEAKAQLAKGTEATKALEKQAAAPSNAGKASKLEPLQRKVAMLEVLLFGFYSTQSWIRLVEKRSKPCLKSSGDAWKVGSTIIDF